MAESRLNAPSPFKVNNNNSIDLVSQIVFQGKKYDELNADQKIKLMENLNQNQNFQTHKATTIAENDRKAAFTRKKMGLDQGMHELSQEFK